jgi:hypothetical protein
VTSPNTRDIRLNVRIDSDDRGVVKTAKGLDDTAKAADRAGDSFKSLSLDAKKLDQDIAASTKRIAELRAELVNAGNDKGIRKALRGEESWLRELTKISVSVGEAGGSIGAKGIGSAGGSFAGTPVGAAVVGGIVAGAAPFLIPLGAMVAGTVAGAIGTGGIAGGIAMAANDSRVKASAAAFGKVVSEEFFSGGDAFVVPVQRSLRGLSQDFESLGLGDTFAKMAPHVGTIAGGLGDLAQNVMPGLNKAFDRMGPFAEAAAEGMGQLGSSLGTFMDDVTSSEGAVEGLGAAFAAVSGTIVTFGKLVNVLSDGFDKFNDTTLAAARFMEGFTANSIGVTTFFHNAAAGMAGIEHSADGAAASAINLGAAQVSLTGINEAAAGEWKEIRDRIDAATRAQDAYFNSAMAVPEANDALEASFDAFTESLKENGRTFDAGTEKGRANREAMRDLVQGAQDVRSAMIDQGQSVADANRKYDENIAKIEAIAAEAGITKDALLAMAGDYTINIYRREITHKVTYFENHDVADTRRGFAEGGTTPSREPFWVGEKGPELMFQDRSHFVATAAQSKAITSGGGTGVGHPIQLNGGGLGQVVFDWLEGEARRRGMRVMFA